MLSIAEIRKDNGIMRLVQDVTNRFIQNDRPTPQPQIYKKLQGRDDILNSLVAHDFLHRFFGDELVPGLLAFEYGDSEILKTVKEAVDVLLRTLDSLLESNGYKRRRFEFAEILETAQRTHNLFMPDHLRLSLLVLPMLGKFLGGYEWTKDHSLFEWVEVNNEVLKPQFAETIWGEKVKEILKREESEQAELKKARARTGTLETTFNQYQLIGTIGEGGAGRVWEAADSTGLHVAVKILDPDRATSDRRKRFQNEVLFCTREQHLNIIKILDFGVKTANSGSTPFYVMPLLQGSLRKQLPKFSDPGQMSVREVARQLEVSRGVISRALD